MDKKKVMFYNDRTTQFVVDEEFQKLWRGIAVESMDDEKIEEYLSKQVSVFLQALFASENLKGQIFHTSCSTSRGKARLVFLTCPLLLFYRV